ncbi:MAG: bifunctional sugar-1-phosphate nucleotidylyltransferase/acetyltransferase [Desulfurococcaceae archaeon]
MEALVLAGGKGERLRPITETRPKPLVPILCRPLLGWIVESLKKIGIRRMVVVASYMEDQIRDFARGVSGAEVEVVSQGVELGSGDAVLKGLHAVRDDEVLIVYGDIFLKNFENAFRRVAEAEGPAMAAVPVDDPSKYGVLKISGGKLVKIVEKPDSPPSNVINAGIYKLAVSDIESSRDVGVSPRGEIEFTDIVNRIASAKPLQVVELEKGSWIDIGYPWNLIEANKMALELIESTVLGTIEEPVKIKGKVYVGEGALIRSFTYVEGPAYIGDRASIGPSARIRPYSVICDGASIGFSVEVKESLIFEGAKINHLAYVGDSIVCEHANLGAGTITANLRLDEGEIFMKIRDARISTGRKKFGAVIGAHVKTGVNVSFMPGVKVGSHSAIAAGLVIDDDVPPGKFVRNVNGKALLEDMPIRKSARLIKRREW